jgi:hypothetical protein
MSDLDQSSRMKNSLFNVNPLVKIRAGKNSQFGDLNQSTKLSVMAPPKPKISNRGLSADVPSLMSSSSKLNGIKMGKTKSGSIVPLAVLKMESRAKLNFTQKRITPKVSAF